MMTSFLHRMSLLYTATRNASINARKTRNMYKWTAQFHYFCNVFSEKYNDVLAKPDNIAKETWEDIRNFVNSEFKPPMVDSYILEILRQNKCPDAGISYYKFLENNNYNPTVITTSLYLQLYRLKYGPVSETDKSHILNLCNNILNEYSCLDHNMSNILSTSLSMIGEWKKAIKIINKFEATDNDFLRMGYSSLITCLFDNDKVELGYKYLQTSIQNGTGPLDDTYISYLQYCMKEKDKFNERVERLFTLWSNSTIRPSDRTALEYMKICNEYGWSAKLATLIRSNCSVCKQNLTETHLTDEEYKRLVKVTKDKLILNKMYDVSNPHEVNAFVKFIDTHKPYDIVIDGLNMIYSGLSGEMQLKKYVRNFRMENKKVLVIGKDHMLKTLKELDIIQLADYFLVKNMSKDDAFLLYAAFSSGKCVKFLSNDFMRQHKFAVKDAELTTLFRKWQLAHQYFIDADQGVKKYTYTKAVLEPVVQKTNSCWHVPYVPSSSIMTKLNYNSNWMCFNMNP